MAIRSVGSVVEGQSFVAAAGSATVFDAAALMRRQGKGALLVLDGTRLVGIVTERDIVFRVVAVGRDPRETRLAEIMTPQPLCVHPDKPFVHALRIMHEGGFRHLPVVEHGRPMGVLSARDALDDDLFDLHTDLAQRVDEQD